MSLVVQDLTVRFGRRQVVAVDGVSFEVAGDEKLGLIGASGSGKSVTALAIMGLLPEHARVTGSIQLDGRELVGLSDKELRRLRGQALSMIFQEPMTALDPTMRVGRQVAEAVVLHRGERRGSARDEVREWLERVGLDAERVADAFPHQLSGGQRQRALIAMALVNRPGLVLCDEPTTALDVIVQQQVLDLLRSELEGRSALFISHDLAVVRQVCPRALVMHGGRVIESGAVDELLAEPRHEVTRALVRAACWGSEGTS